MFNIFKDALKSKKDVLLTDMRTVYEHLLAAGQNRLKYSQSWNEFARFVKTMVLTQNAELEGQMDRFVDLFAQISDCQKRLAEAEIRNAEDFNDVAERFAVVYRMNDEYIDAKIKYREYSAQLKEAVSKNEAESAKPSYEKNRAKLEGNIERLRGLKSEWLENTKQTLRNLIECREKYTTFKVRRFTHGWTLYGTALKEESEKECDLLQQVEDLLGELKNTLEGKTVESISSGINGLVDNTPAPVQPVKVDDQLPDAEQEVTTNPQFNVFE